MAMESNARDKDRVRIFDTTLRDGEQAAGAAMTPDEKLEIAKQLERLGVDIIESGVCGVVARRHGGHQEHRQGD